MIRTFSTNSDHPDFITLVKQLDAELAERDGPEHAYYAQFNTIDRISRVIVAYVGDQAVGCGGMKEFTSDTLEVKRMYVLPEFRGKGIASAVLKELESWAVEDGYPRCVLETGKRQPEAISLYQKNDYRPIPNYGPYIGVENSCCFEKVFGTRN